MYTSEELTKTIDILHLEKIAMRLTIRAIENRLEYLKKLKKEKEVKNDCSTTKKRS